MTSTSTLYQGIQSCLEPKLLETRVLMNKLVPSRSNLPQPMTFPQKSKIAQEEEENEIGCKDFQNQDDNVGGWSFIQALENPCQYWDAEDEIYVHPLVKICPLNTKSLEMCTESLGSETGSDINESIQEFSSFLSERETNFQRSECRELSKKLNREASFPPPLTSMGGVQVRPHREGGRLVLKAVTVTSCNSYFRAERANGRLRLSLLIHDQCRHGEEDDEEEENVSRKLARPTRCKATGNKGIPSREPFWVAIS